MRGFWATREDDERLLRALRLRDRGIYFEDIARLLGKTDSYWRTVVGRVNQDYGRSEA